MRFKALTAKSARKGCGGWQRDPIGSGTNILVPEANPDGTCRFHKLPVRVDHFHATNGMGDIHGLDPSTTQANHLAEVSVSDETYCRDPEPRSQNAVERCRGTAWMCPSTLTRTSFLARMAMALPATFPRSGATVFLLAPVGEDIGRATGRG